MKETPWSSGEEREKAFYVFDVDRDTPKWVPTLGQSGVSCGGAVKKPDSLMAGGNTRVG